MIQKIKNTAFEQYDNLSLTSVNIFVIESFEKNLLEQKLRALKKGFLITDDLIAQAESFIERNKHIENRHDSYCPSCLKAHIMKKAQELGLTEETIDYLNKTLPGEVGHNGYYMDNDELIEVSDNNI
jgi:hypothetical protein